MKVFVCCVFIIANISYNGKASLERLLPTGSNILFEDTTKSLEKMSCYRPCKFNVKPKQCYYNFKIEPTILENGRAAVTINGMTPGPPIQACVNDIIIVEVHNNFPSQDISVHWHGIDQNGTPFMDGVPMITQCPIAYGQTYKYAFVARSPGTYFYHADSVSLHSDGFYGSLIINQPQPLEPHSSLYEYDRSSENTLTIASRFPELLTAKLEDVSHLPPDALIINGDEEVKVLVMPGFAYRLRLINAIAIECPVTMNIENHEMIVIATDGKPTRPVLARSIELYPGERMDVVVRASQEGGGYWIRAHGRNTCSGLTATGMLIYSGFNYTSMLEENQTVLNENLNWNSGIILGGQMLESLYDQSHTTEVKSLYLGIDKNIVKVNENEIDFRYISDAIPKKPFFPAALTLQEKGVVQINGKNFLYPSGPLLLNAHDITRDVICKVGEEHNQVETQCMEIIEGVEGQVLELALVNEGFGSNDSYTFHMHGYSMQVIATWQNPKDKPISKEEFQRLDKGGKILRNIQNPPLKDTITVPNKGYTIIRIKLDRKGTWLMECRSCGLSSLPAAVVVTVPLEIPKSVMDSLPKCGNYRPPDVLLN